MIKSFISLVSIGLMLIGAMFFFSITFDASAELKTVNRIDFQRKTAMINENQWLVELSIDSVSNIWTQPLFTQDRTQEQPINNKQTEKAPIHIAPPLTGIMLTGIMISEDKKVALLKDSSGVVIKLKEGQALTNGWVVDKIDAKKVSLIFKESRQELMLLKIKLPENSIKQVN